MNENQIQQTTMILAAVFAVAALITSEMGAVGSSVISIVAAILFFSIYFAAAHDGVNRRIWNRVEARMDND